MKAGGYVATPGISARHRETIVWASPWMRELEADIACALECDLNVMITGETGLGKRSIARRIHHAGRRASEPCVSAQSLDAPDSLTTLTRALLQAMPDGTVHLEAAEQIAPPLQLELLAFTEGGSLQGPGGRAVFEGGRVRIVTIANRSLFDLVRGDRFCKPLFYRLNAIHLVVPPLRDRIEDIPVLLRHFLSVGRAPIPQLSSSAWRHVVAHRWPGNVCEVRAVADALLARGLDRPFEPEDLAAALNPPGQSVA
jgi:DNA-binding NtrC family response regulator